MDALTGHRDGEIVQKVEALMKLTTQDGRIQKVEALMELTTQDGRIHKPCQSEKLLTLSPPKLSSL